MATLNRERERRRRQKKRTVLLTLALIELLLSPVFVSVLYQASAMFVSGSWDWDKALSNLNYFNAVRGILASGKLIVLWLAVQGLFAALLLWLSIDMKPALASVDMQEITEDIKIPVAAGNGQYGNERFLTEREKKDKYNVFYFSGKEVLDGKGGLVVHFRKEGNKEAIYYIGEDKHALIIGASGAGKTRRLLFETIFLQLLSGVSVVVSDVKGEIFYFTSEYAKSRGYDVHVLDLRNPKKSDHYNYLKPILGALEEGDTAKAIDYTWDLVSVLVGQQKGEPLWYNGETATIAAAILCVCLEAPPQYRNLANVYYFIAYMCEADPFGNMPLNAYLARLADTHPAKSVFAMAKIAASKTRSSFFTSALGTLRLFTNPNVAAQTGTSDFDLKDIGRKKSILYMIIPDEKKTLYPLVSILVTQMYSAQVELANESGLRLPVDTDYDLDEVGNFPFIPCLGNILSAGRSRGVRANLVIQDMQQLESKYKDDFKNIRTNCQIKMYLKSDDQDTLKFVSETLGKYTVEASGASSSINDDKKSAINYSSSASLAGRALLEPAEVKRIKSPYCVCMITGEYGAVNYLPDLSSYSMNRILGMGDEAHNTALVMERETERREHDVPQAPELWGIWNELKGKSKEQDAAPARPSFLRNKED